MNVLITGGAGFIGLHLAKKCLSEGCEVTLFDSLSPQVHAGVAPKVPIGAKLVIGDVTDRAALHSALTGHDTVVHLAAETGTGQSMYEVSRYAEVNVQGTANLFDILVNEKDLGVKRVVTASSRAIYGEGAYHCNEHGTVYPNARTVADLKGGVFEPRCPICAELCSMRPTTEAAHLHPTSFYGISKQVQEQMTLLFAEALGITGVALRYQNVYGPGQSLKNPYTGILAIFATQARAHQPIYIFEDGLESRDFVYIDDVIDATWRSLSAPLLGSHVFNVGSGEAVTVTQVAESVAAFFESRSSISTTGNFRIGDIRHNLADISCAQKNLGYASKVSFQTGVARFLEWASQEDSGDHTAYERSLAELKSKALMG